MIPRERILSKLDLLLKANDYQEGKRLLQYWLSEARHLIFDLWTNLLVCGIIFLKIIFQRSHLWTNTNASTFPK